MKQQKNLTLAAYETIKEMMQNYEIVPGQRLVFVDLAKKLGVSRTPVNNALGMLAKEGYLDFVPNQGYTVHILTRQEAEALYELREILELGSIGKAIRRMTPEKLARFEKRKLEFEEGIEKQFYRQMFVLDAEFHAGILDMLDNPYLVARYREIWRMIFLRFRTEALQLERFREIAKEHQLLFDAVRIRDVEWAKDIIKQHNLKSRENLFAVIFRDEDDSGKIRSGNEEEESFSPTPAL